MSALHLSSNRMGLEYNSMKLKPNYHDNRHFSLINNLDMKELNNCKMFDYVKQSSPPTYYPKTNSTYGDMVDCRAMMDEKPTEEMMEKSDEEIADALPPKNGAAKSKKRKRNRKRKRKNQKTKPSADVDPTSPLIAQFCAIDIDSSDTVDGFCSHSFDIVRPNMAIVPMIHSRRTRLPSDCESEDSFIVFGDENVSVYPQCRPRVQSDCLSEDSFIVFDNVGQCDSSIDDCDEVPRKRVRFASEDSLCEVHPMIQWSYAYQKARKGPWEQFALDRMRFKNRVNNLRPILDPILEPWHRNRIYKERFEESG